MHASHRISLIYDQVHVVTDIVQTLVLRVSWLEIDNL
jgi:hypothetical protein